MGLHSRFSDTASCWELTRGYESHIIKSLSNTNYLIINDKMISYVRDTGIAFLAYAAQTEGWSDIELRLSNDTRRKLLAKLSKNSRV